MCRAPKCLRPCDRLSIPVSVISIQLIIRTNEVSQSFDYSLPAEAKSDDVKSRKMSKALR